MVLYENSVCNANVTQPIKIIPCRARGRGVAFGNGPASGSHPYHPAVIFSVKKNLVSRVNTDQMFPLSLKNG